MRDPKVIFTGNALAEIDSARPHDHNPTEDSVTEFVTRSLRTAHDLAEQGLQHMDRVCAPKRKKDKKKAWRNDSHVRRFFGNKAPITGEIYLVRWHLCRVMDRLERDRLKIRLLPQKQNQDGLDFNGHNYGGPLSPKRFVLYPAWFSIGTSEERGAIIVHELLHDRLIDAKVKVGRRRETARGPAQASLLADQRPRRARRNPENYEQFCLSVAGRL